MIFRLGLIINPFAGIGGSVGLKGSDGDIIRTEAFARGAQMQANLRMQRCLKMIEPFSDSIEIFCFTGDMGESLVKQMGFRYTLVGAPSSDPSNATDTISAASILTTQPIDILLFAGGDGTARNIADGLQRANAMQQVVLGVPSGVKMHSGVYAVSPEAAGEILLQLLTGKIVNVQLCDVRDIDEDAFREGKVKTHLYNRMHAPMLPQFLQQVKNSGALQDELAMLDIANSLIDSLDANTLYIVGPGSTTFFFLEQLNLQGTLLGVDILLNNKLIAVDVTAEVLRKHLLGHAGATKLIITAIGGQGHIIGRGNQQIMPDILRAIGRDNIQIIATKEKILALQGRPLLVDSNDPELDRQFSGYQSVLVGYDEYILYPIGITCAENS